MENFSRKVQRKNVITEFQFPTTYYEENLAFKRDKTCWAAYQIKPYTYDYKSKREKFLLHNNWTRLLWNLKLEGHIRAIPITTSIREDNEELKRRVSGPLKMEAIREIDEETMDLTQLLGDEGNDYEFYVLVKLQKPGTFFSNLKEFGKSIIQDPIRWINEYAGLENPEIFLREIEAYKNIENTVFNRISKEIAVNRADEYIVQKLIRQPFYFGIGEVPIRGEKTKQDRLRPDKSKVWKPYGEIIERNGEKLLRPHSKDVLSLTECEIDISHMRHLEINQFYKGRERKAYQSYVVISNIPDIPFPGGEWLYGLLSSMNFPINVSIRFKIIEYKASINEVRKKQRDLADVESNVQKSNNAIPLDLLESNDEVIRIEHDLKNQKFPLLDTTIILGIAAKDKETLNNRIETLRNHLGDIQSECPAGDQFLLFNEMQVASEQYAYDYLLKLTPEHLAGAMIGATKQLGDEYGIYAGITGTLKKPVRIAPWKPSIVHKPPNVTFSGPQGGGKSYAADLIALKTIKYYGAKGLWIDPKGDRWKWEEDLKSFAGQVKVTTFTADKKDKGKLDPFNIMRSGVKENNYIERMKEAGSQAMNICMFLIAADRKDPRTVQLLTAINRVVNKKDPSMNKIIEEHRMMAQEAIEENDVLKSNLNKEIAATLNSYKEMPYSSLLFGDGDEEAISLQNQINVLQIQNLVFPSESTTPENYTFQEIIGYACLLAITTYILMFIMNDRKELALFVMDEATVLRSTPAGKSTANKLLRMARALFSPGYFLSQSVDDVGDEKERNNIGYKFAFRSTDEVENIKTLKFFGLDSTEENLEVLSSLETGLALFQDLEGRTGVIAIDSIFEEYDNALKTGANDKVNDEAS